MTTLRIGDFARLGGVSVRTLHHYHDLGLLLPSNIDPDTGYRFYDSDQLRLLATIVTLKNAGVSLADVERIVGGELPVDVVRLILSSRKAEIRAEMAAAESNLASLDRHLAALVDPSGGAGGPSGPDQRLPLDVEIKTIEPLLVAQLSAVAESWHPDDISPVIRPLYPRLVEGIDAAGIGPSGQSMAWYADTDDGRIAVHATIALDRQAVDAVDVADVGSIEIVELPALPAVATTRHRGSMDHCDITYQALLSWIDDHGRAPLGYGREVDVNCGPDQEWVTELQIPIDQDGGRS